MPDDLHRPRSRLHRNKYARSSRLGALPALVRRASFGRPVLAVPHLPGQRTREPATAWTQPKGGITAERGTSAPHPIQAANRLHILRMP